MKKDEVKRRFRPLVLVAGGALLLLSSCQLSSLLGVNQDSRLSTFFKQADNNQQNQLYTNFSSSISMYDQIKSPTYWTNFQAFTTGADPILGSYQPNPINGTSVSGSFTSSSVAYDFSATFVQSGADWYFSSFSWTPSGGSPTTTVSAITRSIR